ncbi:MAG: tRNA lysidine(34) synthetase TilS [Omnitrophica WOR_2 bacterium RIFCSPHIGHO2_02_FULL_52_10]|nr:MAG: tRNA lysidine(34) synthetase TilS [Omnitrophica WOR_2 bacterium RIFCSPHIGHO2_02_FULL_52_10]
MNLMHRLRKDILSANSFDRGDTVIIGASGGPDSTALTHILHALQYEIGFHLHIAHYNHNLHRQSGRNQKFVEKLAEELNVPCTTQMWRHPHRRKKGSLEDAARQRRLQFFSHLSKRIGARAVVLAHTKDDLAETVLMRILRGTGLQGLRGIAQQKELNGVRIFRPMLNTSKEEILSFLKKRKIPYRNDPTNRQKKFFRNKIRLELLPLLTAGYNRNIKELLVNLAEHIDTDYNYLEDQVARIFTKYAKYSAGPSKVLIDRAALGKQHPALQRMLIRAGIEKLQGSTNRLTFDHYREIEDLLKNRPQGSVVHLPRKIHVRKDQKYLTLTQN